MFTIDSFWKLLQIVQGGTADDDVTEAIIALAKNEATSAEKLFSTVIDQAAFSTADYYGLRNFIRDLYATHRTLTTYQTTISDVWKMPNDQLDELFRSFGYPYSTSIRHPTGNESPQIKINFFLDLVNLYKRKGTPQALLDLLNYYGINKVDLYELSLLWDDRVYGNSNDIIFKTNKIAGTSEDKSNLYFDFEFITERDPHWLQTKDQVKYLHTINKINFPSQSPYFAIKPVYDEKTIDAETGIISRQVKDQYTQWVLAGSKPEDTDPTLPQDALLTITGDQCSFLTNYLACVYTFNKLWTVGSPAARYVCYDGTNISVQDILEEFDTIANVRVDTHAQWKVLYDKYLDIFTLPISENFLQDHLDARDVLTILNPTVKSNLDTLSISLEEVLGSLLTDLGEWIRSYMSFGFTNIGYILFGLDSLFSNLRKVIEFFKPYRARLIPLEYLQFTSRLFNSVIVEDQFNFDVNLQFHDFLTGDSEPCCNGEINCFSEDVSDLIKVSAPIVSDDSSITVFLPDPILDTYSVVPTMSSRSSDLTQAGSFGMIITSKGVNQFEVLLSSPTSNFDYWLDFIVMKSGSNAGIQGIPVGNQVTVTLPVVQADSSYPLLVSIENLINPTPSKYAYTIIDKTPTSFTVKFSDDIDSADYFLNWIIPNYGKIETTQFTDTIQTIVLPEEQTNNYYAVSLSIENLIDLNSSQYLYTVVDKTTQDFKVKMNAPPDSTNYNIVWNLFRYRDTIGKGDVEEDVCIQDATSCLQTQTYSREFYDCGSFHDEGAVTDAPRELFIEIHDNIYDNLRCPIVDTTGFVVNEVNTRIYKSNVEVIPYGTNTIRYNMEGDEEPDPYFSLVACISNVDYPDSSILSYVIADKDVFSFRIDLSDVTENPGYRIDWTKSRDPDNSGLKGLSTGDMSTTVNFTSPKDTTSPILIALETTDTTSVSQISYEITGRTINGFTVRFSHPMPTNNYILNWIIPTNVNSGIEPLPNGLDEVTVVFPNPTLNEMNAVVSSIVNIADATSSIYPFQVIEKTITSFKVKFASPIDSNNYYFSWYVQGAENKLDELLFIQTGGFRHFDEEGIFDCTHGFDLVSITIEDITDYMLLEDGFYILQENGDRVLL
jgi:hypothetical protein